MARAFTRTISCAPTVCRQQRIVARRRVAVPLTRSRCGLPVHVDEQQADVGVDQHVAEALEHAVAVVVGKRQLVGRGDAHEARRSALERAVGPPFRVGGREEEIDGALDERLVVGGEGCARQLLLQPVGDAAAVERVLQPAVAVVIHDARRHVCLPDSNVRCPSSLPGRTVLGHRREQGLCLMSAAR